MNSFLYITPPVAASANVLLLEDTFNRHFLCRVDVQLKNVSSTDFSLAFNEGFILGLSKLANTKSVFYTANFQNKFTL